MRSNLGDLRGAIEAINREIMLENGGGVVPNPDVLKRLKASRPNLIAEFERELTDMALVKLINEVAARKRAKGLRGDSLFFGYGGIPAFVSMAVNIKKATPLLTLHEADTVSAPRIVQQDPNQKLRQLVDDCRVHFTLETDTLEMAWNRKQDRDQPKLL